MGRHRGVVSAVAISAGICLRPLGGRRVASGDWLSVCAALAVAIPAWMELKGTGSSRRRTPSRQMSCR